MYQPETYAIALAFMVTSMLCWGSWANTMKLTPRWPFQLFYWDYVVGIVLGTLVWGFTLGSAGHTGLGFLADLRHTDGLHIAFALGGGAVFNVANILLVAALEIAGMAVAFPVGIGLALIVGVLINYAIAPRGSPLLLFGGALVVLLAIVLDAMAYRRRETSNTRLTTRGILLSVTAGLLMGCFYPLVEKATLGDRGLGPYGVAFVFALGIAACTVPVNFLMMRRPLTPGPAIPMRGYLETPYRFHAWGILGGLIWCTGAVANFVASHAQLIGPAISYAIGQGATMISAAWGVFIWREFARAPRTRILLIMMFVCFIVGLLTIAVAPLYP